MRPVYAKDALYDLLLPYVNWSFRRVFRSLEFQGLEDIPDDGAIIFSPNHVNTLLDALAVLAMMDNKPVVFAARADIFRKPAVAKILNFLRIVPINRIRDGVDALAGNEQTFRTAIATLKEDIPFCIFPEGRHSQDPGLLPLRKGIARIAMQAVDEIDRPVYIVPIGLVYEDYVNFRTDLTINVGEAVLVAGEKGQPDQTEPARQRRARKLLDSLAFKMRALIDTRRDKPVRDSLMLKILRIPLVPFAALLLLPAFGIIKYLSKKMKDKAFLNSVRYGICYLVNPVIIFLLGLILGLCGLIPWWLILVLPVLSAFAPEIWYGATSKD
ncbi:MAG: 1-acyl-sn-glycerol-3-phosphate acyltransferase [Bacteroidales bacterium]|nr:1-acyl-sn-glycerol-3-phosphate acyltransferase [Bacteroidales bacterium]